jgi:hypothetical protein
MEAIKQTATDIYQPQKNGSETRSNPNSSLEIYSTKPSVKAYQANIIELLKRIRRLANAAPLSAPELALQSADWTEILIDEVPLEWLPDLYKRAAWNHPNSHMVNAFDLIAEYRSKRAEIAAEKKRALEIEAENNPVMRCTQVKRHVKTQGDDKGIVFAYNYFSEKDELMPCPHCRTKDLEAWKKTQLALYGEVKRNPIEVSPSEAVEKVLKVEEVYLSAEEGQGISNEYNGLVAQIVDMESAQHLFVIFDEGANRFRHPQTAAKLYTAKDMQRRIDDYKKILADKTL